jgi:hypothetical protein
MHGLKQDLFDGSGRSPAGLEKPEAWNTYAPFSFYSFSSSSSHSLVLLSASPLSSSQYL